MDKKRIVPTENLVSHPPGFVIEDMLGAAGFRIKVRLKDRALASVAADSSRKEDTPPISENVPNKLLGDALVAMV